MNDFKWSWPLFWKGFSSKQFIAFVVITVIVFRFVNDTAQSDDISKICLIVWAVITVVWMLSEAWKKLIEKGNLNIEAKLGATNDKGSV